MTRDEADAMADWARRVVQPALLAQAEEISLCFLTRANIADLLDDRIPEWIVRVWESPLEEERFVAPGPGGVLYASVTRGPPREFTLKVQLHSHAGRVLN